MYTSRIYSLTYFKLHHIHTLGFLCNNSPKIWSHPRRKTLLAQCTSHTQIVNAITNYEIYFNFYVAKFAKPFQMYTFMHLSIIHISYMELYDSRTHLKTVAHFRHICVIVMSQQLHLELQANGISHNTNLTPLQTGHQVQCQKQSIAQISHIYTHA